MDHTSAILLAALAGGLLASMIRLPPLVGFLAAGFVLHAAGVQTVPGMDAVAGLGVTVLLFGIGLKVEVRSLLRREVWLTASLHMVGSTLVGAGLLALLAAVGIGLAADGGPRTWLVIGFALSFSSTVVVVKVLEDRGATRSLGGRTAIGILVIQDVAAVGFMALAEGQTPSPWAVLLVLVLPGALVVRPILSAIEHGELLPLYGIVLALVPGYALFEALGIKGDIGALVMGMLLAGHPRAGELSKSLFEIKDLLLVAFFLSIGLSDALSPRLLGIALLLVVLLPLKALGYSALLWVFRLRRRTSVLTGLSLANFSEFGLIVVVVAPTQLLDRDWVTVIATAVAASFVLSALPGRHPEYLAHLVRRILPDRSVEAMHPENRPLDVQDAQAVILGMGRVGAAAYARLAQEYGLRVLGVETSEDRYLQLERRGLNVVRGDATDPELWVDRSLGEVSLMLLAMPFHGNNLDALSRLRAAGFGGTIAVVAQYDDNLEEALAAGAHAGIQFYDGAGAELADRAVAAAQSD